MSHDHAQSMTLAKYLRFDRGHLAPLTDVTPNAIKEAAHLAVSRPYCQNEPLQLTTALNFIVGQMGFTGGFAEFQHEHAARLDAFMHEHGMARRADLIRTEPRMKFVGLQPRQVSDALFLGQRRLPSRLFTAYDVDWFDLNNRFFRHNPWSKHPAYNHSETLPYEVVMREMSAASEPDAAETLAAAVAACQFAVMAGADNLLGDQLYEYANGDADRFTFVAKLYQPAALAPEAFAQHSARIREVVRIFREWMQRSSKGWVRVVPFNPALIFLQDEDGAYDFVVRGFRDEFFDVEAYPRLTTGDVPKATDDFHFQRWLYFIFDGWLERERHFAEMAYYARGGEPRSYPGADEVLRQNVIERKIYRPRES